jgi:hypothetical protein
MRRRIASSAWANLKSSSSSNNRSRDSLSLRERVGLRGNNRLLAANASATPNTVSLRESSGETEGFPESV